MSGNPENFIFKNFNSERIPAQRIGVVLAGLEQYTGLNNEFITPETLTGANQLSVERMTETEMVKFLDGFLIKLQAREIEVDSLKNHQMFQAVLTKALRW